MNKKSIQQPTIGKNLGLLKRLSLAAFTFLVLASISFTAMAQTWSITGSLSTARDQHTATLFSNGNVLVSGGRASSGALASCELYDASTGTWSNTGSLATARYQHTATLLSDGKVLVTGGIGPLASCELYDPSTGSWSSTGSLATARYQHTATLLSDGKVLVTAGGGGVPLASCELYDPSVGTWSSTGSLVKARTIPTATLLSDGKVLLAGGVNYDRLNSCELYDPSVGTWSNTGSMAAKRFLHAATLLSNGKVLVTGSSASSGGLTSCELYNPSTGTWSNTGSLATSRYLHTSTLLSSGEVLVIAGNGPLASCELYDTSTGTWSNTGSLATAKTYHTSTLLSNGKVLLAGGYLKASCELYGTACTDPTVPTLSTSSSSNCGTQSTTLSIASGTLNSATNWQWYSGSCGGTSAGSGTSVVVSPSSTTTYYARAEGGCVTPGTCASITITVSGQDAPTGANITTGNVTISTQTQMDAFYSTVSGANNGKKWSKVNGDLTIYGNNTSDPITSLCNLSSLTEVTGHLTIRQFTNTGNPTHLYDLSNLTKVGRLTIISNSQLLTIALPNLADVEGSLMVRGSNNCKTILFPKLSTMGGGQFNITRNHRAESIIFSDEATSFAFTGSTESGSVDIQNNGDSTATPLTINLKKITSISKNLTFSNNNNTGVSNFDAIFTNLTLVSGKLQITNNPYLTTCCIAASATVVGGRTISGNTGNCIDLATVSSVCGTLNKRGNSKTKVEEYSNQLVLLNLSPNPNKGQFTLELVSATSGTVAISITDLLGRQVYAMSKEIIDDIEIPLNIEFAAEGQYIVKAQINGQVYVKKMIVTK